ncbi:M23 family metallopeptidase, partial [Neoroseomonas soli]
MALGHALLHPDRVRRALDADASADAYGATMDGALGLFGFGDPGPPAAAWAEGIRSRAEPVVEAVGRAGREGPFAAFFDTPSPDIPGLMAQLGGIVDAAATLDADALRLRLTAAFDTVFAVIPDLRLPDIAGVLNTEIDAALGILEAPLLGGRRDAAAHRAFRTAAEIRRRLHGLADPLPPAFTGFDLKVFLRTRFMALLARLDAPALGAFGTQVGAFKDEFGKLFDALGRVSVRVEVQAGGPQPMADPAPTVADEAKVTPFPVGHALWWLDLITGIVAVFNLIWEMVRTGNFKGRGFDGFVSVVVLLWQMARVITRAAAPQDMGEWPSGTQWLFSDQGDFVLSFAARLLATPYDAGKNTVTNWVGSVLIRGLKHVTAVSQVRFIYQFARSMWYFDEWNKLPEASRPPPSFLRTTWAAWGPMWMCGLLCGLFPSWDDFHLEGFPTSLLVWLIIGAVCALAVCIGMLIDRPKRTPPAEDHATHGMMTGVVVLLIILVAILVEGLESDDKGAAIGALIGVSVFIALAIFFSWLPKTQSWGSFLLIAIAGLIGAYAVPFVLWWDYIDDGRDKPGVFENLSADSSPYRLPFTAGENWMCSQGTHGIFSHHTKDGTTNHYAFDFNEVEGSVVRAARDGVITELQEAFEDRKQDPNYLHVLHTSWVQGHDPGEDDERVITFGNYFHLMQGGVLPVLGQAVRRGDDIARLDSTGRSAQQHIHIATEEQQRGEAQGLPFVFGDEDTKGFRHYPLLAWIGGKGKIAGKPVSYAFYTSGNAAPDGPPPAATLELALGPAGIADHMHRVFIPAEAIAGTDDPVIVFAEPQHGHSHRISLTRAAIAGLRRRREWSETGITVEAAPDGHDHAPLRRPLRSLTLELKTGVSATAGTHQHDISVDLTTLLPGIPATTTVTSTDDYANVGRATPAPARHRHAVDLTAAAIRSLLQRDVPAAAEVTVQVADGHAHGLDETFPEPSATTLPELSAALVAPPLARLAIGTPGPYRLFGGQAILRINDRVSEAWLLGAHRPELHPDLPAERGFAAGETLRFDTTDIHPATDTRGSARLGAAAMTRALRTSGGRLRHAALVPVPVIVIETRIRGSDARLRRTGGAGIFGTGAGPESRGAGDLPDIGAIPRAALTAHVAGVLQNGWAAPPVAVGNAFQAGGPPLDLTPSAPRNAAVLALAAAPADGAIATPSELPLHPGLVGVTGGWAVPILAAPAVLRLDLAHAAMTGAQRQASPLLVIVSGASQAVTFTAADADADAVARRIMLGADGVRAWAEGATTVVVATVAGGSDVSLSMMKDPGLALGVVSGASAPLTAGGLVRDSAAVTPAILRDVVADAAGRDAPPYDPAVVQPAATEQGDRIRLAVAAGHTVRRAAEGLPLLAGTAAAGQQWDSDALPAILSLAGSSWTDIEVDGATLRVPLTGEPARIEIGPLPRLPANSDRLELDVNGAPLAIVFDGLEASVAGVAARIAAASNAITVRFAYRLTVCGTLHGEANGPAPLRLSESQLLNVAGYLRDRATLEDAAIGPVGDALQAGPRGPIDNDPPTVAWRRRGARSARLTVPAADPPSLVAAAGDTLAVTVPTGGDPFGLTVSPANTAATTATFPVALPRDVATWGFAASQGGTDQAVATAQVAAMPA